MSERVAILVIHGIGQEQPYETLDQFSRNLLASLNHIDQDDPPSQSPRDWTIQPQLDRPADPTGADTAWIRASYRLVPPADTQPAFRSQPTAHIEDVTLFEYYWAPVTQDKITYTGSLAFLAQAGFKPFLYLAANLKALGDVEARRHFLPIVIKELLRQAFLFVPLLMLFGLALWWLQSMPIEALLKGLHINAILVVSALLFFIRYLYLFTSIRALQSSLGGAVGWQRKPLWRAALVLGIALHLLAWPLLLAPVLTHIAAIGSKLAAALPLLYRLGHWATGLQNFANAVHYPGPTHAVAWFFLLNPALAAYTGEAFALLLVYWVRYILVNYVGDVAVYCNGSQFSKTYTARAQILNQCSLTLTNILLEREPGTAKPVYDRVLIAAHSLGTIIAYDTMNVLLNLARTADIRNTTTLQCSDLARLRGLITFGSPLNKIFYFFREQGDAKLVFRRQTIDLLKGFRVVPSLRIPLLTPTFAASSDQRWKDSEEALERNFTWLNAYSISDPISGKIIFYKVDRQVRYEYRWPFLAHLAYWDDPRLYNFFRLYLL